MLTHDHQHGHLPTSLSTAASCHCLCQSLPWWENRPQNTYRTTPQQDISVLHIPPEHRSCPLHSHRPCLPSENIKNNKVCLSRGDLKFPCLAAVSQRKGNKSKPHAELGAGSAAPPPHQPPGQGFHRGISPILSWFTFPDGEDLVHTPASGNVSRAKTRMNQDGAQCQPLFHTHHINRSPTGPSPAACLPLWAHSHWRCHQEQ